MLWPLFQQSEGWNKATDKHLSAIVCFVSVETAFYLIYVSYRTICRYYLAIISSGVFGFRTEHEESSPLDMYYNFFPLGLIGSSQGLRAQRVEHNNWTQGHTSVNWAILPYRSNSSCQGRWTFQLYALYSGLHDPPRGYDEAKLTPCGKERNQSP
jgi:hypothetical protein